MIKKIKIKMLSKRRIEPKPTGVEACIKIDPVTHIENLRSTSRSLKQSKRVRFDYLQFLSSLLGQFSFASRGCFFIMTGKHPFGMQKVRKDLFLSLKISEIGQLFFRKTYM